MSAPAYSERKAKNVVPVMQLKPILEAQEEHGPIFRRDLFDHAYAIYHSINDQDPDEQVYLKDGRHSSILRSEVTLLDIYGKEQKNVVLREGHEDFTDGERCVSKRVWIYNSVQGLGIRYGDGKEDLVPFQFGTRYIPTEPTADPTDPDFEDKVVQWRSEWDTSKVRRDLVTFLEENAGQTAQQVDQIICFGLGRLVSEAYGSHRHSYVQHLAACTVRDIFAQSQCGNEPKIYAQDPSYGSFDTTVLSAHFGITVLQDPEGFKALDGNTFVITIAPDVPVRQLARDMTHDSKGPAGLLCNAILDDGLGSEGKSARQVINGETMIVRNTDDSSPSLWTYKGESTWTELDDGKGLDCLGRFGVYLKKREDKDGAT